MPVVPLRRQVQTQPIPGVQRRQLPIGQVPTPQVRFNPQPVAAGFGEQLQRTAGQLTGIVLDQRERERRKQDEIVQMRAERQAQELELKLLYDPERGAYTRKGIDAVPVLSQTLESYDKGIDEISKGLHTDDQRLWFEQNVASRRLKIQEGLSRHTFEQMKVLDNNEIEASIQNARELAMHSAVTNPAEISTHRETIRQNRLKWADRNGVGPEVVEAMLAEDMTKLHDGVIRQLISAGRDQDAQSYFKAYEDEISGERSDQLRNALKTGSALGDAIRASDAIRQQKPFGGEGVTLQSQLDEAAKISDPEVRARTEDRLRSFWSLSKQEAAEVQQQTAQRLKQLVDETQLRLSNGIDTGLSIDVIMRDPSWPTLPDNVRKDLISYAKLMEKGTAKLETDQEVWGRLWRLGSNPSSQQDFAKLELWKPEYRGKLSDSDYQELVKLQGSILKQKPEETAKLLDDWRTATQVINQTLKPLGILEDSEQYKSVTRQLAIRQKEIQQRSGKPATNDELQKALDGLLIELVTSDGYFWDTKKRAYQVEEGDIPKDVIPQIDKLLQQGGFPITPENRTRLYIEKLKAEQGKK